MRRRTGHLPRTRGRPLGASSRPLSGRSAPAWIWSSYWYNDRIFANDGLGRPHNPGGRGFDVYNLLTVGGRLVDANGNPTFGAGDDPGDPGVQEFRARKQPYSNPQTQDTMLKTP